ncbi:MFS general substrate transporter [Corynespora cassiicola Philippines]|uniref:MFS general substrate transporter n=1 Tax=Corynespora cassiicola Philippines TaxID=1448308 RepID=A0A2T2P3Q8_CORCC|nr:MFS general substrate transporter [Corynespora cassiicola Philippines]
MITFRQEISLQWNFSRLRNFNLLLMMFLAQMESTITSTSVITITDDLGSYKKNSWMLTAYWLTTGAFKIIWAKISDIIGRKTTIIAAVLIFTVFSGACGGSQTITQLIMFRWLQGICGCGILALGQLLFFELVSPPKYPPYIALVTSVVALSLVIGPLVGGGITVHGDWRWVFLLNVPMGGLIILELLWVFPRQLFTEPAACRGPLTIRFLRRIDFVGFALLLGSCLFITTGLQQAAIGYAFGSAFVLPLLIFAGPFAAIFIFWQWILTTRRTSPDPVFPWRFCQSRIRLAMILISWTNGVILSTCVVQIPRRFITVNGMTPLTASARFLAFGAFVPTGSTLAVAAMNRLKIKPYLVAAFAILLQIIGTVLLSRASTDSKIQASQYGMQTIVGIGVGIIISVVITLIPEEMEEQDVPIATAAQSQFRLLGGLMAVSIGAVVTTRYLEGELVKILPPDIVSRLMQRTETLHLLSGTTLDQARDIFGKAYNRQMYVGVGLASVQAPLVAMMATNKVFPSVKGNNNR